MALPKSNVIRFPGRGQSERDKLLASIVSEHDEGMRRFLRMRRLSPADLEDVLQDVYLKLARMDDLVERLSASPDTVRSYMFVMASNIIRDKARKAVVRDADKHVPLEESLNTDGRLSPEAQLSGKQQLAKIEKTLKDQKPDHRRAFSLSRFGGLSYREIADDLSVSISTVEKYISRVLYALRQELDT